VAVDDDLDRRITAFTGERYRSPGKHVRFANTVDPATPALFGEASKSSFRPGELAFTSDSGHLSEFLALEEQAGRDSSTSTQRRFASSSSDYYYQTESESDIRVMLTDPSASGPESESDSVSEMFKKNP
jgi:hypothetical protein